MSPESTANPGSSPSEPVWAQCPSSKHISPVQETTQEYDDRKSTTERTLSAPGGLFRCPFHFSSFSHQLVSLYVSLFFSLLSLRRGFVVVCFEVTIGELLCLFGLRQVISGILAGGISGFRMVLLLLHSPSGMAWWFWCYSICFCRHTMSRWYNVIFFFRPTPSWLPPGRYTRSIAARWIVIIMQGCLLVDSHKSTGSGPVRSPVSCPSKKKPQTKNKRNQANKKHTTTTKPKQTKTQRSGIATSYGNNMHDDILCVIVRWYNVITSCKN